jgi:Fe-S oxidoreductase
VLWPDTLNNHIFPGTLAAAVEVLEDAGYRVVVPRGHLCCGRALYDFGMLDLAKRLWARTMRALEPAVTSGVPVVGLEPSCVAAFRDELPNLFPKDDRARKLCEQTKTLAEFLRERRYDPPHVHAKALVQGHCQHRAVLQFDAERELLKQMQLELEVPESGCCGLAGSFGYEADHYDISMQIGERVILPAVRGAGAKTIILADGFSCREQIEHGTGRTAYHIAELLAAALYEGRRAWLASHRRYRHVAPADMIRAR